MPYYSRGTAADEQELVGEIETFLTSTIGTWVKIDTVTDDAATKDLVFRSPGSGQYRDIYLRLKGNSNYVYLYGYSYWGSSIDYDGEISSSSYLRVATGSSDIDYWLFGDIDYIWIIAKDTGAGTYCSGYGGLIDSYYDQDEDDLPLAIVGCANHIYSLTSNTRIYMYSALVSGTKVLHYAADTHSGLLEYGDPSDRNNNVEAHTPFIIYNNQAGHKEIRGELKGAIYISGASFSSENWITISGTNSDYFIKKYSDSNCEGFGPTVSG